MLVIDPVRRPQRHSLARADESIDPAWQAHLRPEVADQLVAVTLHDLGAFAVAGWALSDRGQHLVDERRRRSDIA